MPRRKIQNPGDELSPEQQPPLQQKRNMKRYEVPTTVDLDANPPIEPGDLYPDLEEQLDAVFDVQGNRIPFISIHKTLGVPIESLWRQEIADKLDAGLTQSQVLTSDKQQEASPTRIHYELQPQWFIHRKAVYISILIQELNARADRIEVLAAQGRLLELVLEDVLPDDRQKITIYLPVTENVHAIVRSWMVANFHMHISRRLIQKKFGGQSEADLVLWENATEPREFYKAGSMDEAQAYIIWDKFRSEKRVKLPGQALLLLALKDPDSWFKGQDNQALQRKFQRYVEKFEKFHSQK